PSSTLKLLRIEPTVLILPQNKKSPTCCRAFCRGGRIALATQSPSSTLKLLRIEPTVLILPQNKKSPTCCRAFSSGWQDCFSHRTPKLHPKAPSDRTNGSHPAPEQKKPDLLSSFFVGVAGFEPTTSTSQMWRDTGLRYTPKRYHL